MRFLVYFFLWILVMLMFRGIYMTFYHLGIVDVNIPLLLYMALAGMPAATALAVIEAARNGSFRSDDRE